MSLRIILLNGYSFLAWNLFLAWIPFLCALAAEYFHRKGKSVFGFWIFTFLWLIFFPNAPYILTDFMHLSARFYHLPHVPWWFDFGMISVFAFTGILLGVCSLLIIQKITIEKFGAFWSWLSTVLVSLLAGFGIYLGRYLRWNSWDILLNPQEVLLDITDRLSQPLAHPQTWLISLLFGALIISFYLIFSQFCDYRSKS